VTTPLYLISLHNTPIFEQLQLEEALLRSDERNFCIINQGSPRSIVMGISAHPPTVLNLPRIEKDKIPTIRRFSGGGTVIVDESTLFVTFIFSKKTLPVSPFPEPILRWTAELYASAWKISGFALCENDYTIGPHKCGGNAQYIQKDRWLHHTSFLWDYQEANMDYLLMPPKQPRYRAARPHTDFLCRLKHHAPSIDFLTSSLLQMLSNVKPLYIESFDPSKLSLKDHRKSTHLFSGQIA
jgi:lipoate-protein ligase A